MAGAWKEIVDSSFKINGKPLNAEGITIGKEDIAGLVGDLSTLTNSIGTINGDITSFNATLAGKVSTSFKIGAQALTGTGITLVEASIPDLKQTKITGLVGELNKKMKNTTLINGVYIVPGTGGEFDSFTLDTSNLIPEKAILPATGKQGEMVKQGNQIYIWRETA